MSATLRPLSPCTRTKVRALYQGPTTLNDAARRALARAVWVVMDDLENRQPTHPQVSALRAVYNVLGDDTGENERHPTIRYPAVEAAEAVIRRKRKTSEAQLNAIRAARALCTSGLGGQCAPGRVPTRPGPSDPPEC